jgi:hypothetical protein
VQLLVDISVDIHETIPVCWVELLGLIVEYHRENGKRFRLSASE